MYGPGNFVSFASTWLPGQILMLGQVGGEAAADAAPGNPEGADVVKEASSVTDLLMEFLSQPLNLILVSAILFMFIVVRPQQKQMKALRASLAGLRKNDRVVTASGIHGTVVQAVDGEDTISIRIDENSGTRMTVTRESIAKVLNTDNKTNS